MSLRHALLGLLHDGPASGYDLLRVFKLSLANSWPATQSQIYTELGKLADAGMLEVSAQGPRGRKEYSLTESGRIELRRWLLETTPERHPRSESLLRVFLLGALTPEEAKGYLAWLGERAAADVELLEQLEGSINWDGDDLSIYGRLVMEFGKRLWVMSQEWSDWAVEQIEAAKGEQADRDLGGVAVWQAGGHEPARHSDLPLPPPAR